MSGDNFLLDTNVIIGLLKQAPAAMAPLERNAVSTNQSGGIVTKYCSSKHFISFLSFICCPLVTAIRI